MNPTAATLSPEQSAPAPEPLSAHDRCDAGTTVRGASASCGAQAYVRATLPGGGVLLFCRHHSIKHAAGLAVAGAAIDDHTHLINAAASASSA